MAISANGRVVVGSCSSTASGDFVATAFIWDEQHGMRELASFLRAQGAFIAPELTIVQAAACRETVAAFAATRTIWITI